MRENAGRARLACGPQVLEVCVTTRYSDTQPEGGKNSTGSCETENNGPMPVGIKPAIIRIEFRGFWVGFEIVRRVGYGFQHGGFSFSRIETTDGHRRA